MWPKKFSEGWGWELATRGVDGKTNSWEKFVEAWKSVVCMGRTEGLRAAEGGERGAGPHSPAAPTDLSGPTQGCKET